MKGISYFLCFFVGLLLSCKKDSSTEPPEQDTGKIIFEFANYADGLPLQTDTLMYINQAGNHYMVTEVKYFISDVTLHKSDGAQTVINKWKDIFYVDNTIPSTLTWQVYDDIPQGNYDSISFTFGINEEKNKTFLFVNTPEVNMFWPTVLGGGYHYMQINGKWKDTVDFINNFNFHLGIGQIYKGNVIDVDSITGFVQNYFKVNLPASSFSISKNETKNIQIIMNIESWFKTPNVFDFNYWGGDIMQKQAAMQAAKENGFDVFSVGYIR